MLLIGCHVNILKIKLWGKWFILQDNSKAKYSAFKSNQVCNSSSCKPNKAVQISKISIQFTFKGTNVKEVAYLIHNVVIKAIW